MLLCTTKLSIRCWPGHGVCDMPNYITATNQLIVDAIAQIPNMCLFGQNINTGTFISGLSKNLRVQEGGYIINTSNCENTLCGMGFGMMLSRLPCAYVAKQLDFMLLGIDHFVNTYNFIRCSRNPDTLGSFSSILLLCDQGMQGPQSSFNSFGDFCSIARIPCYSLTNKHDTATVLRTQLRAPGFRMIGLSSRLCRTEFLDFNAVYSAPDSSVFQYTEGDDATIVCYNFALAEGYQLHQKLQAKGIASSLFFVNYVPKPDLSSIQRSVGTTSKLVVIDDSKSVHLPCYEMIEACSQAGCSFQRQVIRRDAEIEFGMSPDQMNINLDAIATTVSKWTA